MRRTGPGGEIVLCDILNQVPYLVVKLPGALFFALSRKPVPHRAQSINYPKELDRAEMRGMLSGPLTYFQSLWALRGMRRAKR